MTRKNDKGLTKAKRHLAGKGQPLIRSLKLGEWPDIDGTLWEKACAKNGRLTRGGAASHLKPVTRNDLVNRYGLYLNHVQRLKLECPNTPAGAVTPDTVATYLEELQQRVSSVTVHGSIAKLRRVAMILAPTRDFAWLRDIENDLALDMCPSSKFGRLVDAETIVLAGLKLMAAADDGKEAITLHRAELYRNGLMIALLPLCPIRLKNFAGLAIGENFVAVEGSWHIALRPHETKERRPDERAVPSFLTPYVKHYLEHIRPIFGHHGNGLWVGRYRNQHTANAVARIITETTRSLLGKPVSPHLFRSCAASSVYLNAGHIPHLASALLNHRGRKTTEDHYNRARSASFAKRYADMIEDMS